MTRKPSKIPIPTKGEPLMVLPPPKPKPRPAPERRGHAANPGTGPVGMICGGCAHCDRSRALSAYCLKETVRLHQGILVDDPACHLWKARNA